MDNKIPKTISYSALSDWDLCSHYYYLVDIERLKPWKNTPDTIFGKLIHTAVQNVLSEKVLEQEAVKVFQRKWKKFCTLYKQPDFLDYIKSGENIINNIKSSLQKHFGNFKVVHIEFKISTLANEKWPQLFKGFIDIVLQLDNGKLVIADFKTADSAFLFKKFKETTKDYQLILYKHFYCIENKIDPKNINTSFIILEKNSNSKNPVCIDDITSGHIKIQNALNLLNSALSAINRKLYIKKRTNCFKFAGSGMNEEKCCVFYNSVHCPKR